MTKRVLVGEKIVVTRVDVDEGPKPRTIPSYNRVEKDERID